MAARWEPAFVAVSALLGESVPLAAQALMNPGIEARSLIDALQSPSRPTRARAIASGVSEVVTALEAMRLE
jgi:hypothetical protein